MSHIASLASYLELAYSEPELRMLPTRLALAIDEALPGQGASRETLAVEIASILERRGLLDGVLARKLIEDRPARQVELDALVSTWPDSAGSRPELQVYVRSESFGFSQAFACEATAPASVLLELILRDMALPRREPIRDVVIVAFTYRLCGPDGELSLEKTLGDQGVGPMTSLLLLAEARLLPIAPRHRTTGGRVVLRGDGGSSAG